MYECVLYWLKFIEGGHFLILSELIVCCLMFPIRLNNGSWNYSIVTDAIWDAIGERVYFLEEFFLWKLVWVLQISLILKCSLIFLSVTFLI